MKTELVIVREQRTRDALADSEQRYRRLLGATTDYIYTVHVANGCSGATSHGAGCLAVTGYSAAEFEADPYLWYRVIHDEDRAAVLSQINRVLQGELPPPLEHRITPKQGGVRWIRNTTIPHRDPDGRLVEYDGLITDITDRKRAELILAAECAVAHDLADQDRLDAAMHCVVERLCCVLLWHYAAYWHREGDQLLCESQFRRAPPAPPQHEARGLGRILPLGEGLPGRVLASQQATWLAETAVKPEQVAGKPWPETGLRSGCAFPVGMNGKMLGVVELYSRDAHPRDERLLTSLTTMGIHIAQFAERRCSQERLEEERNLLRTLIDHLPDCIYVKDIESRFLLNNSAHARILGAATPADAFGKTDHDFFPEELASQYRADEEAVLREGQVLDGHEEPVQDPTGKHYCFLTTKVPLQNGSGTTVGLVGISRNITELKRVEGQLRRKNQELESTLRDLTETRSQLHQVQRLEAVGTLAAGVAHEVKNPLQILSLGTNELAGQLDQGDGDVQETLREMRDAITRANTIIKCLLDFSRLTNVELQPSSVVSLLNAALRLQRFNLLRNHVRVQTAYGADLPEMPLDQQQMQQVFINLIGNASEAMPDGGDLIVRAYTRPCTEEDRRRGAADTSHWLPGMTLVTIEMEDTGKGMPDEVLAHAFDPFYTTKPRGVGTGLGLSVARNIVSLHGGMMYFETGRTRGARIIIQLLHQGQAP